MIDGCFRLVRKKHSKLAITQPFHKESMFADQDNVDNFENSSSLHVMR